MKKYKPLNQIVLIGEIKDTPTIVENKICFTLGVDTDNIPCYSEYLNELYILKDLLVIGIKGEFKNGKVKINEYFEMEHKN